MAPKKVLIVEDENIIGMEIKDRLEGLGYDVPGMTVSGENAIEMVDQLRPDIILMDISLKGEIDGVEAARRIWERRRIPIIYLTAYTDQETLDRARLNSDPVLYLIKPFEEDELKTMIQKALSNAADKVSVLSDKS